MPNNQVTPVPPAIITQAKDLANQLATLLTPYLEALTPKERKGILKMGDKTIAFVDKALDYAQNNPQFGPAYMDIKGLSDDVDAVSGLTEIEQPVKSLAMQLDDTIMVAGSEAYTAALSYYSSVKLAAKRDMPGAKPIADDLKVRFERAHEKEDKAGG